MSINNKLALAVIQALGEERYTSYITAEMRTRLVIIEGTLKINKETPDILRELKGIATEVVTQDFEDAEEARNRILLKLNSISLPVMENKTEEEEVDKKSPEELAATNAMAAAFVDSGVFQKLKETPAEEEVDLAAMPRAQRVRYITLQAATEMLSDPNLDLTPRRKASLIKIVEEGGIEQVGNLNTMRASLGLPKLVTAATAFIKHEAATPQPQAKANSLYDNKLLATRMLEKYRNYIPEGDLALVRRAALGVKVSTAQLKQVYAKAICASESAQCYQPQSKIPREDTRARSSELLLNYGDRLRTSEYRILSRLLVTGNHDESTLNMLDIMESEIHARYYGQNK